MRTSHTAQALGQCLEVLASTLWNVLESSLGRWPSLVAQVLVSPWVSNMSTDMNQGLSTHLIWV